MRRTTRLLACSFGLAVAGPALARVRHRVPAFEPTDLDLENPSTVELGLQFGLMVRDGEPSMRWFVPDFEVDIGLTDRVEVDIDGALSVDYEGGKATLAGDNLWVAPKLGFLAKRDPLRRDRAWALGSQLDAANRWSLLVAAGGGYSLGPDPHDLHATLGFDLAPTAWLDLSLVGFYGFLAGGDRYGLFFGITPKM